MLINSWTLLPESHKSQAGQKFVHAHSQDLSAQLAAEGLRSALLEKGLQCIDKAHKSLFWAVQNDKTHEMTKKTVEANAVEVSKRNIVNYLNTRSLLSVQFGCFFPVIRLSYFLED